MATTRSSATGGRDHEYVVAGFERDGVVHDDLGVIADPGVHT